MIEFGSKVQDIVSGITGVVTAKIEYITGCIQYGVQPPADKDGKLPDSYWIDEIRLKVLKGGIKIPSKAVGGSVVKVSAPTSPRR